MAQVSFPPHGPRTSFPSSLHLGRPPCLSPSARPLQKSIWHPSPGPLSLPHVLPLPLARWQPPPPSHVPPNPAPSRTRARTQRSWPGPLLVLRHFPHSSPQKSAPSRRHSAHVVSPLHHRLPPLSTTILVSRAYKNASRTSLSHFSKLPELPRPLPCSPRRSRPPPLTGELRLPCRAITTTIGSAAPHRTPAAALPFRSTPKPPHPPRSRATRLFHRLQPLPATERGLAWPCYRHPQHRRALPHLGHRPSLSEPGRSPVSLGRR